MFFRCTYLVLKRCFVYNAFYLYATAEVNDIKNGPFYGIVTNPVLIGSIPGIKVDENCRVLDAQNQAIKNLFACGELIFGNVFSGAYVSSGSGVGISAYTGAIAADAVIEELK